MILRALTVLSAIGLIVFMVISTIAPAYCQEEAGNRQLNTFSGIISSVNWVDSTVKIRYIVNRGTHEAFFSVPPEAKIFKRNRPIWFSEVNIGDHVIVSYYTDHAGVLKIASLTVEV